MVLCIIKPTSLISVDKNKAMPAAPELHFVVVGCGPGGLCAALSLAKSGHTVTALEANDQLDKLGAGLTTIPRKPSNSLDSEIGLKNGVCRWIILPISDVSRKHTHYLTLTELSWVQMPMVKIWERIA